LAMPRGTLASRRRVGVDCGSCDRARVAWRDAQASAPGGSFHQPVPTVVGIVSVPKARAQELAISAAHEPRQAAYVILTSAGDMRHKEAPQVVAGRGDLMAGSLFQATRSGCFFDAILRESPRPGISAVTIVSACCADDRHACRFRARGPITKAALTPVTWTGSPALAGVLQRTIVHFGLGWSRRQQGGKRCHCGRSN